MLEGYDVRISGQDVEKGTLSHRHAMLVDQKTENVIVPLNDKRDAPGKLELANSKFLDFEKMWCVADLVVHLGSLSEMGVLGVSYGLWFLF
jgi:probable 2-oxoglutarate dehydrogenase E1 component DHKTD1